jgi:hypothetical protein
MYIRRRIGGSITAKWLAAISVTLAIQTQPAFAQTSTALTLQAPCAQPATSASSTDRSAGLNSCSDYIATLLGQLRGVVQANVDQISKSTPAGMKICALVPNSLVMKDGAPYSEERTTRFGDSCGDPMQITVSTNPLMIEFHKEPVPGHPAEGSLEDSWLFGAQEQATAYYLDEVSSELQDQKTITIRPYSQGPSYCAQMATDYGNLLEKRNRLMAAVSGRPDAANIADQMKACSSKDSGAQGPTQQAANLCATRMALEQAFLNVASCEVLGRAQDSYLTQIGSAEARTHMFQWIRDTMKIACSSCQSGTCANQCYQQNVGSKMRDYLKNVWPVSARATPPKNDLQACANLGIPWLVLGLKPRRRRRS